MPNDKIKVAIIVFNGEENPNYDLSPDSHFAIGVRRDQKWTVYDVEMPHPDLPRLRERELSILGERRIVGLGYISDPNTQTELIDEMTNSAKRFRGHMHWVVEGMHHCKDLKIIKESKWEEVSEEVWCLGYTRYQAKIIVFGENDSGFRGGLHYAFGFKIDELVWEYYDAYTDPEVEPSPYAREARYYELPEMIVEEFILEPIIKAEGVFNFDSIIDDHIDLYNTDSGFNNYDFVRSVLARCEEKGIFHLDEDSSKRLKNRRDSDRASQAWSLKCTSYQAKIIVFGENDSGFRGRLHYAFGFKINGLVWEYYDALYNHEWPDVREVQDRELLMEKVIEVIPLKPGTEADGVVKFDSIIKNHTDTARGRRDRRDGRARKRRRGLNSDNSDSVSGPNFRDSYEFIFSILADCESAGILCLSEAGRRCLEHLRGLDSVNV